jgi:hypothetical protein
MIYPVYLSFTHAEATSMLSAARALKHRSSGSIQMAFTSNAILDLLAQDLIETRFKEEEPVRLIEKTAADVASHIAASTVERYNDPR